MNRLDFLKRVAWTLGGATVLGVNKTLLNAAPSDKNIMPKPGEKFDIFNANVQGLEAKVTKPVTVIIIGAGGRGNAYATYAKKYPNAMKIVGVSDINEKRREMMADAFNVKKENRFGDFSEVFKKPQLADAVVISTPDDVHYAPCMLALEKGYQVLLEKPIAPTEKECTDILAAAKKHNRIVAVCHVLRYAPYFVALKQAVDSGVIGDVISVQHLEPILFDHMAHSYVRGNWHNSKKTTPIILAKSCHDLDIIRWIVGKPCTQISADGSLTYFKASRMPAGATAYCIDGCPHESTCPFSAVDIYVRRKRMLKVFDLPEVKDELIKEKLRTTNYGRCVFQCDNDQPDHYVANMVFDGDITASFSMEALTSYSGRRTRIMGTKGDIVGDMTEFVITDFRSHKKTVWNKQVEELEAYKDAGHGGGDLGLVRDFIQAVGNNNPSVLSSTIDASVESHVMGFRAEESRLSMSKVKI
ncbi:MAG: Gfo/Idh/MocA family oxidoreductase [Paludibacter sp.]|nr:Gfo/Idh/MocA family oxidoreductase [Paludibacter sp.]